MWRSITPDVRRNQRQKSPLGEGLIDNVVSVQLVGKGEQLLGEIIIAFARFLELIDFA
jgi:hypothetical protein